MSRKSQLLALARSGGAAAVAAQGPGLWPRSIRISGNSYVLRSVGPFVGHYMWADRGVALTLEDAQVAAGSNNRDGLSL